MTPRVALTLVLAFSPGGELLDSRGDSPHVTLRLMGHGVDSMCTHSSEYVYNFLHAIFSQ